MKLLWVLILTSIIASRAEAGECPNYLYFVLDVRAAVTGSVGLGGDPVAVTMPVSFVWDRASDCWRSGVGSIAFDGSSLTYSPASGAGTVSSAGNPIVGCVFAGADVFNDGRVWALSVVGYEAGCDRDINQAGTWMLAGFLSAGVLLLFASAYSHIFRSIRFMGG